MGYLLLLASRNIIINVVVGIFGGSFLSNVPRTTYEVPIPVKIPLLKNNSFSTRRLIEFTQHTFLDFHVTFGLTWRVLY